MFRKQFVCGYSWSTLEIFLHYLLKMNLSHAFSFCQAVYGSVFFHKLSNKFVQRNVLIHKLIGQGALGWKAHMPFNSITLPSGRALPKIHQTLIKCNLSSRAGRKTFSVIPMFRQLALPIFMPKRDASSKQTYLFTFCSPQSWNAFLINLIIMLFHRP